MKTRTFWDLAALCHVIVVGQRIKEISEFFHWNDVVGGNLKNAINDENNDG